ncbi:MAG: hypothetical protein ABFD82_17135 [Syntrophaceae bacterium]
MITKENAIEIAANFIGFIKKEMALSKEQIKKLLGIPAYDFNPNVGFAWEFNGSLGTVAIAESSGEVVTYIDSNVLGGAEIRISETDAESEMHHFLANVYRQFNTINFKLVKKESTPSCFNFTFEQMKLSGEQSIFTNFVTISVCGDKPRVISFDRSSLAFIRRVPPKLSRDEAQSIIQRLIRPGGKITAMDLFEQPIDHATRAVTVWAGTVEYNVGGLESLDLILINADTGDQVILEK